MLKTPNRIPFIKRAVKALDQKKKLAKLEEIRTMDFAKATLGIVDIVDAGKTAILTGSLPVLCYKRDSHYCIEEKNNKQLYNLQDFKYNVTDFHKRGYKHTTTI